MAERNFPAVDSERSLVMAGRSLVMARSVREAVRLKNGKSAFLAGGTEINRLGSSVSAPKLIGIGRLGLDGIEAVELDETGAVRSAGITDIHSGGAGVCPAGISNTGSGGNTDAFSGGCGAHGFVKIGAAATFQELVESDIVPEYLKEACRFMSSRTKRNMATIGGNAALLRDDSYLCATLLAARARLEFYGLKKLLVFEDFLKDRKLYKDRLITALYVNPARKVVSRRYANTAASHAVLTMSAGCCKKHGFTVAAAVKGSGLFDLSELAEKAAADPCMPEEEYMRYFSKTRLFKLHDDIYGSASYKRYLLGITSFDLVRALTVPEIREAQHAD